MKKGSFSLLCIAAVLMSSTTFAGNRPGAVTLSLGDAYYHFDNKRKLDNTSLPNIALAYNFDQHWAVEGGLGLLNTNTTSASTTPDQGTHGFLYTVDGIYRFQRFQCLEPYVLAGVGVLGLIPNGDDAEHQGNINAGIGAQFFADPSIAFRLEARDLYTIMSGGKNDYMINLSINLLFDTICCCKKC